ncbi:MAG: hypothetical protein Q9217_001485 [Psora testacea]
MTDRMLKKHKVETVEEVDLRDGSPSKNDKDIVKQNNRPKKSQEGGGGGGFSPVIAQGVIVRLKEHYLFYSMSKKGGGQNCAKPLAIPNLIDLATAVYHPPSYPSGSVLQGRLFAHCDIALHGSVWSCSHHHHLYEIIHHHLVLYPEKKYRTYAYLLAGL